MEGNGGTERNQKIIEHLQEAWQSLQVTSSAEVARISEFILGLQEPYKSAAMKVIAEHVVSTMNLHLLALMATFQSNAQQEDILLEDCQETFEQILPEAFHVISDINRYICVQSFDNLVALSNITGSLQTLSNTTSAEEAQSWLYELPGMYYRQLKQEQFIAKDFIDWTQGEKLVTFEQTIPVELPVNRCNLSLSIKPENIHIQGTAA
ncbi:MAG TPA: hypothetical protein VFB60_03715 [Ktedonobacteraceae bacterium]|nr:hypothetical protein [Ktedonobacteraceae bacterium]